MVDRTPAAKPDSMTNMFWGPNGIMRASPNIRPDINPVTTTPDYLSISGKQESSSTWDKAVSMHGTVEQGPRGSFQLNLHIFND